MTCPRTPRGVLLAQLAAEGPCRVHLCTPNRPYTPEAGVVHGCHLNRLTHLVARLPDGRYQLTNTGRAALDAA